MSCALYTVARVCVLNDDILCMFMMVKIRIFILFVLFVLFVSFSTREKRDEFFSFEKKTTFNALNRRSRTRSCLVSSTRRRHPWR